MFYSISRAWGAGVKHIGHLLTLGSLFCAVATAASSATIFWHALTFLFLVVVSLFVVSVHVLSHVSVLFAYFLRIGTSSEE